MSAENAGSQATFEASLDFTMLQKNEVQWWEPWSCRHLAAGRDDNISVLWESLLSSCENTGSGMENEPAPQEENTGSLVFHDGSSGMKVPF